jgi:hypothetical protein
MAIRLVLTAAVMVALTAVNVTVAKDRPFVDEPRSMADMRPDQIKEYVWKEGDTQLPPFPEEKNLIEFQVDTPNPRFRYFIDANSLKVGEEDGVSRYSLVIRSTRGSENISFEGMHCEEKEYKTYAFGTTRGEWRQTRNPKWAKVRQSGYVRYRWTLWESYLCAPSGARQPDEVIQAIKYPNRKDGRSMFY